LAIEIREQYLQVSRISLREEMRPLRRDGESKTNYL
jgi:hypothetical protein